MKRSDVATAAGGPAACPTSPSARERMSCACMKQKCSGEGTRKLIKKLLTLSRKGWRLVSGGEARATNRIVPGSQSSCQVAKEQLDRHPDLRAMIRLDFPSRL